MTFVHRIGFTRLASGEGAEHCSQAIKTVKYGRPADAREIVTDSRQYRLRARRVTDVPPAPSVDGGRLHRFFSCTSSQQRQVFWLQDYLAPDIPQARVWTHRYNADVVGGLFQASDKNSISQHGRNLALRLEHEIENEVDLTRLKSLGGILVQDVRECVRLDLAAQETDSWLQAMRWSEASRRRMRLILFLATSHRGSRLASWGKIASNLAQPVLQDFRKKIIETLKVDSEVIDNIQEQFDIVYSRASAFIPFRRGEGCPG
ncbi:MAG: hypothetical protein Q9164_001284 [Protoblastenia rupestris]